MSCRRCVGEIRNPVLLPAGARQQATLRYRHDEQALGHGFRDRGVRARTQLRQEPHVSIRSQPRRTFVGDARCAAQKSPRLPQGGMDRPWRRREEVDAIARQARARALFCVRDDGGRGAGRADPFRHTRPWAIGCLRRKASSCTGSRVFQSRHLGDVDRTRAYARAGGAAGQDHANAAHRDGFCSATTRRSASMWRSQARRLSAACGAWTRWARPGARTCTWIPRTGGAASDRRCSAACCVTTGPAVRRHRY